MNFLEVFVLSNNVVVAYIAFVVVVLLFYVHTKYLRSCRDV